MLQFSFINSTQSGSRSLGWFGQYDKVTGPFLICEIKACIFFKYLNNPKYYKNGKEKERKL